MVEDFDLQHLSEYEWELPQDGEMNVPARVFASEKLLEVIRDDRTLEQARNITHFPGIHKYACVLPDAHQGYGMPVGGVVALDVENGGISPGAVGYDINCLSGDAAVLLEFGRRKPIQELEDDVPTERPVVAADRSTASDMQLFMEKEEQETYTVETETGETVEATTDHPFQTADGMVPLENLEEGDTVMVSPFQGLPDEEPERFTVLDRDDFDGEDPQLVKALTDRDLLPLRTTDREFNILLKLVGFHTGDGAFNNTGKTTFYANKEDLKTIQRDIRQLGFSPSSIYERDREHEVDGNAFESTETSVSCGSKAFQKLLIKLGAPGGAKVESSFTTPSYIERLAVWQKALYLSAFFGAEMSKPAAVYRKNFYCPTVSHNRVEMEQEAGEQFMHELKQLLASLDIETTALEAFEADSNRDHEMMRFRFGISSKPENLVRFLTTVGYRYNLDKQKEAIKVAQYTKKKEAAIRQRAAVAEEAVQLYNEGTAPKDLKQRFDVNDRFIERSIWSGRDTKIRPPQDFPDFEEYRSDVTVRDNLTIPAEIGSIDRAGRKPVYDIGVDHEAHNFQANSFVVSNCGVRVMTTNLAYDEIRGKEQQLANILFQKVPSGLGEGAVAGSLSVDEVEDICLDGLQWAVDNGYAVEDDMEHCEDEGFRESASVEHISDKAKNRAAEQVGSLGSGNHFLEVQRVSDIYDGETAAQYGLAEDQVVVTIHCGSRGLGHQVCSDFLRRIEQEHQEELEELPDKELAFAPAGSDLEQQYYEAMNAAINFAWVNRQLVMHQARKCFERIFDRSWQEMDMHLLYDVAHNIAKKEEHDIEGEQRGVYVHRKGSTRAFPAGHEDVPEAYRDVGQPVLIPGSMGTASYILKGTETAMQKTFGSSAHGAGRLMSRTQAKEDFWGGDVQDDLERDNIYVKAQSGSTIAEEAPGVYKDVDEVVRVTDAVGIGEKVAQMRPLVNIKG
ncbi:MAG: RtcB family protein [Candidatus Nanohaloarchaea archaeon]|nr:RtcB family protein [Candidatus Nanohaloarchaea archaeon]